MNLDYVTSQIVFWYDDQSTYQSTLLKYMRRGTATGMFPLLRLSYPILCVTIALMLIGNPPFHVCDRSRGQHRRFWENQPVPKNQQNLEI